MGFRKVYDQYIGDIRVTALSQRVPGLDYDDVVSEMTACLWIAWNRDKYPSMPFGKFWWSLWLNRKADLIRLVNAEKRPKFVSVWSNDTLEEMLGWGRLPTMPSCKGTPVQQRVWRMLAEGYTPLDVQRSLGLSRRAYYSIIREWRTEEVHELLTGAGRFRSG